MRTSKRTTRIHIICLVTALALSWASAAAAQPFAYIANFIGDTVSVIDTATNTVTATINVGDGPNGVAVSPDGSRAYVTIRNDVAVAVIDTATNTVIATVGVAVGPFGVAVSPDGARVYVGHFLGVSVIDTATNTLTTEVSVLGARTVAVSPDGTRVYAVSGLSFNFMSVIDTATLTVVATIGLGTQPDGAVVTPDGASVYVINTSDNTMSEIDTATNTVTATFNVGFFPFGLPAVSPDGSQIYVAVLGAGTLAVIDTATNTVTATVNVGNQPNGVAVTPDGAQVYVVGQTGTVAVIDAATNTINATVSVGAVPLTYGIFIAQPPPNSAPTAEAGLNQSIHVGQTVNLNGTGSSDLETDVADLVFAWSFSMVPAGSTAAFDDPASAMPSFVADQLGDYQIELTVTDEGGLTDSDQVTVTSENVPPQAEAGPDLVAIFGFPVTLDGGASSDADGDPLSYAWTLASSPAGSAAALVDANTQFPTITPDLEGSYAIELVVNDGFESSAPDTVTISAITAEDFALTELMEVSNFIAGLPSSSFDKPQDQSKLTNEIAKTISKIQKSQNSSAVHFIDKMIERTDGCALRGSPDPHGGPDKHDYINNCADQAIVYDGLTTARDALLLP